MLKKTSKTQNVCIEKCSAICCNDLAVEIHKPVTKAEKEELRWHLFFVGVKVYIRNRRWHVFYHSRCRYLSKDNLCTIYDRRPERCRNHNYPDCELQGKFYDIMLENPEQFDKYFAKEKARIQRKKRLGQ